MIRAVALAALLTLVGCAEPAVVNQPVTVEKIVPVPCHAPAVASPAWPTATLRPSATMFEQAKAVLSELKIRQGYEAKLVAANTACQ